MMDSWFCFPCEGRQPVVKVNDTTTLYAPDSTNNNDSTSPNPIVTTSVTDQVICPIMILPVTLFFPKSLDTDLLKHSLSTGVLAKYPLFSGRLRWGSGGDIEVECNNRGVQFSVASSRLSVRDAMPHQFGTRPHKSPPSTGGEGGASFMYRPIDMTVFFPPNTPAYVLSLIGNKAAPIMHVQYTQMACGGSCLVMAVPHLLADLESIKTLMEEWCREYNNNSNMMLMNKNKVGGGDSKDVPRKVSEQSTTGGSEDDGGHISTALLTPMAAAAIEEGTAILNKPVINLTATTATADTIKQQAASKVYYTKEAITPYLPKNGPPSDFLPKFTYERTWSDVPKALCTFVFTIMMTGGVKTVSYYVSPERMQQLKAQATAELQSSSSSSSTSSWVSTNDALVARVWQVVSGALPEKRDAPLSLTLDLRKRLNPPMPPTVIGNVLASILAEKTLDDDGTTTKNASSTPRLSLGEMASKLRNGIQTMDQTDVMNEFAWLTQHFGKGTRLPCMLNICPNPLGATGGLLVSNHDWDYRKLEFGVGNSAVWYQSVQPEAPNVVFIAKGMPCGGAVVNLTLHARLADALADKVKSL